MGTSTQIWDSHNHLLKLLDELGLEVSQSKLAPPSTQVVASGIYYSRFQIWSTLGFGAYFNNMVSLEGRSH